MVEPHRQHGGCAPIRPTRRVFLAAAPTVLLGWAVGAVGTDGVTLRFLQAWGRKGSEPGQLRRTDRPGDQCQG